MADKKRIIILGSGFGSIHTFLELHRQFHNRVDAPEVTIVSPNDSFLYNLLLHEVATGGVDAASLIHPIREIGRCGCGLLRNVITAEASAVDTRRAVITTTAGELSFDYAVVGIGAVTRLFDFDPRLVFTLKNVEQAQALKRHIATMFVRASRSSDVGERKRLLTFVIVGGGPTGVELSTEISAFVREALLETHPNVNCEDFSVLLLQSGSELVPTFKPFVRRHAERRLRKTPHVTVRMNSRAHTITANSVTLSTGEIIPAATAIVVAGVQPRQIVFAPHAPLAKSGQVEVNECLQVPGAPHVFVIVDMASIKQRKGFAPLTAQAARYEGSAAGKNIAALIRGKPLKPFVYRELAQVVSLGRWHAAGQVLNLYGFGPLMWLVWRGIDAGNFLTGRNVRAVLKDWIRDIVRGKTIVN
jgi:NADH:ubiquinone reductase (H+-translocating)